jgi:hypothetical protein
LPLGRGRPGWNPAQVKKTMDREYSISRPPWHGPEGDLAVAVGRDDDHGRLDQVEIVAFP